VQEDVGVELWRLGIRRRDAPSNHDRSSARYRHGVLRRAFATAVLLPVLALAGCGGSGDDASGTTQGASSAPTATATTTGDETGDRSPFAYDAGEPS
jgi:hypothetical protein